MSIMNLQPGAMVMATRDLDPRGAAVYAGDIGIVFEAGERELAHDPEFSYSIGPLVRWLRFPTAFGPISRMKIAQETKLGGVCNVYDGDVVEVKSE